MEEMRQRNQNGGAGPRLGLLSLLLSVFPTEQAPHCEATRCWRCEHRKVVIQTQPPTNPAKGPQTLQTSLEVILVHLPRKGAARASGLAGDMRSAHLCVTHPGPQTPPKPNQLLASPSLRISCCFLGLTCFRNGAVSRELWLGFSRNSEGV